MKLLAQIRLATSLALLLGFSAHAQTLGLCKLLLHPKRYNGHMIRIHGKIDANGISDNYCTPPLNLHSPFDRGIQVSFRPIRNRNWYKFWYYKSFPSEQSGKNPPFYRISGTFYGLFRYQPPKNGSQYSQWTLILASISDLTVNRIELPIFVDVLHTIPPDIRFPTSPPHALAPTPCTSLDQLLAPSPTPPHVSGPTK